MAAQPQMTTAPRSYTREELLLITKVLVRKAAEARRDPVKFFEFVLREPKSMLPIKVAPHQEVAIKFMLDHDRSVNIWSIDQAKTFTINGLTLYLTGQDVTTRGAIISATEGQAIKQLSVVRGYIGERDKDGRIKGGSEHLRLVFPGLRPSTRPGEQWTQTAITVDRPAGIPDPTLVAYGMDGRIPGSRLNWIIIDDLLTRENTATKASRDKVRQWVDSSVLSRLDPRASRVIFTNSAWHPEDVLHMMEKWGWPTLRMDVFGNIRVQDDAELASMTGEYWDHAGLLRPASTSPEEECYRLTRHDPDPTNSKPLWFERFYVPPPPTASGEEKWKPAETEAEAIELAQEYIATKRRVHLPVEFNRLFANITRNDDTAMCKVEWVEACKKRARDEKHFRMLSEFRVEGSPVFTGLDLAVSPGEESDDCAFFTFAALPTGHRLILDIDVGKFDGPTILDKIVDLIRRYDTTVRVENNGCFAPGTNVLTRERGYVPIEQVLVGEHVWTHRARWRPVTETVEGTSRTITEARVLGGVPVRTTPNHWFWMREARRSRPVGEPEWVSVGFAQKEAYVAVPRPQWPASEARLSLRKSTRAKARSVPVDEDIALMLGLFMAEGHTSIGQVLWTFGSREDHLAKFVTRTLRKVLPMKNASTRYEESTRRVIVSDVTLASALRCGTGARKCLPLEWLGWPLATRLAVVRGWLMGDGCLQGNNGGETRFFSGVTVSRNWLMWARSTLLEAGYRPTISLNDSRQTSEIEGRTVNRSPIYTLRLNAADSSSLRSTMNTDVERKHWPVMRHAGRGNSPLVHDGDHAWSRLRKGPGEWSFHDGGVVHNLVVEEDESYTVEDMVVHNAQDFVRQFMLARNVSAPVKPHTTGRAKAHPEHGVPGVFMDMFNGAWIIPNDKGTCHPSVQRWIDECLYYVPSKHTGDILMAAYFAREQAKEWGALRTPDQAKRANDALAGLDFLKR